MSTTTNNSGQMQISMAYAFAAGAHNAIDQRRKYTNEQYIEHPCRVAFLVGQAKDATFDMISAAYLHDTVEDTKVTLTDINTIFGHTVAEYVGYLTETSKADRPDLNRRARKMIDAERLGSAPPAVQTIKYADFIDNTSTILQYDPEFGQLYLQEKADMIEVMRDGDPALREMAIENMSSKG